MSESESTPALPELAEGILDAELAAALIRDYEQCAWVFNVSMKGGARSYGDASELSVRSAIDALLAGQAHGVQVRYTYSGREWWDTILRQGATIKLVRMDQGPASR